MPAVTEAFASNVIRFLAILYNKLIANCNFVVNLRFVCIVIQITTLTLVEMPIMLKSLRFCNVHPKKKFCCYYTIDVNSIPTSIPTSNNRECFCFIENSRLIQLKFGNFGNLMKVLQIFCRFNLSITNYQLRMFLFCTVPTLISLSYNVQLCPVYLSSLPLLLILNFTYKS